MRKVQKNIWPFDSGQPLGSRTYHYKVKHGTSKKYGVVAHFKGHSIWKNRDPEFYVIPSVDKETQFESLKEAKRFLSNPSPPKREWFNSSSERSNWLSQNKEIIKVVKYGDEKGKGFEKGKHFWYVDYEMKALANLSVSRQPVRQVKNIRNPSLAIEEAAELSRKFHGREPREIIKFEEIDKYDKDLTILGDLLELNILTDNGNAIIPISFAKEIDGQYTKQSVRDGLGIKVCSNVECTQIYFKDGNQTLDLPKLFKSGLYSGESSFQKQWCIVGPVYSIVYFADKHHLTGPEYQKKGTPYEHQFGEEKDGELPYLMYETMNKRLALSGGSYEIRPEGIYN